MKTIEAVQASLLINLRDKKMDELYQDTAYTHRLINYLNSTYQGRFAMLNILGQTKHPLFKEEEVARTRDLLQEINSWNEEVLSKKLLFSSSNPSSSPAMHQKVIKYLESIIPELTSLSKKIKEILVSKTYLSNQKEAALLLAAFARDSYCKDNYIRGYISFGKAFNDESLVNNYNQFLEEAKAKLDVVNLQLSLIKQNNMEFNEEALMQLGFTARNLPGTFRAHIHDINQITCGLSQPFTPDKAKFFKAEFEAWRSMGFNVLQAGYWRAYEFGTEEAKEWIAYEILDPSLASEWKTAGFPPAVAAEWIAVLFPPLLAIQWTNASYNPREAAVLLISGYENPDQIPEDQVQDLLEAAFKKFLEKPEPEDQAA